MQTVELKGRRFYIKDPNTLLPSVNTILRATMPASRKQKLGEWAARQKRKWIRKQRKCNNCQSWSAPGDSGEKGECAKGLKGKKCQSPWKNNRCSEFELRPELDNYEPGSAARERGTRVHRFIERFFATGIMPTKEECIEAQAIAYFLRKLENGMQYIEKEVEGDGYAGRLDFYGEYNGKRVLIDWTTTSKKWTERSHYEDKFLQTAAYAEALREPVDELIVVVLGNSTALYREEPAPWIERWRERLEQYKVMEAEGIV